MFVMTDGLAHIRDTDIPYTTESAVARLSDPTRFLRALFDDAPYGVFITRYDGCVAACNSHVATMLGYTMDEILGKHFNAFTHPEDRHIGLDLIRAIHAGDLPQATLDKRYLRRNGEYIWVHLNVSVIRDKDRKVEFFVATFDDVTKEQLQKQALLESEKRLQGLLEAIPYALFCVSADGDCLYHKPARDNESSGAESWTGKKLETVLPSDAAQTIIETARAVLSMNEAFQVDYQVADELNTRYYEAHVAPFGANQAVVLALDVTDRREIERDRAQAQAAIIAGQREVLRQISTPLMPIAQGVIAMPLVGPVDRDRAQQMLATLMDGVTCHGARTVIIDIAGVPNVDTEVAELLAQATQVVKLLGAEALFTGVRPDVARNIIALGIDLNSFQSAGSFQSALNMALRRGRSK